MCNCIKPNDFFLNVDNCVVKTKRNMTEWKQWTNSQNIPITFLIISLAELHENNNFHRSKYDLNTFVSKSNLLAKEGYFQLYSQDLIFAVSNLIHWLHKLIGCTWISHAQKNLDARLLHIKFFHEKFWRTKIYKLWLIMCLQ